MKRYVQSNTSPGNCWQTAVACLLDVDPDELPDQVAIEAAKADPHYAGSYNNALQKYLATHHNLVYITLHGYQTECGTPRGWHTLEGKTERTATNGGIEHVIIGHCGEPMWDPHPSGAGLITVERLSFLLPRRPEVGGKWLETVPCLCRTCAPRAA
jgi:hypothetical protein